jgi:hypothetical protein
MATNTMSSNNTKPNGTLHASSGEIEMTALSSSSLPNASSSSLAHLASSSTAAITTESVGASQSGEAGSTAAAAIEPSRDQPESSSSEEHRSALSAFREEERTRIFNELFWEVGMLT